MIKKALLISASVTLALGAAAQSTPTVTSEVGSGTKLTELGRMAKGDYLTPVRPGEPGKSPFWNKKARQFMYVPSFDFPRVSSATYYRFTATADGKDYAFEASKPWATLAPIWMQLPVGYVTLKVEGLDRKGGRPVGVSGERRFYRAAMYNGPYHEQVMDYQASVRLALRTLFDRPYFKEWMKEGVPAKDFRKGYSAAPSTPRTDPGSGDYVYPDALLGGVIGDAAIYSRLTPRPADADEVLKIGKKAADLLLSLQFPAGDPMEFFPPTYQYTMIDPWSFMNPSYVMLPGAAYAGSAYLDLHDATKDPKYLTAATKIAGTYKKLQLPSGTWYQTMDNRTGKPVFPNLLVPSDIIAYLDRLNRQYHVTEYEAVKSKALDWLLANTVKTFNWQGEFQDVAPNAPYDNMCHHGACGLARYLFDHGKEHPERKALAEELLRYAEDQFINWERPPMDITWYNDPMPSSRWVTPCVQEQLGFWMPVNGSSAGLIETYLSAYRATGKKLYLAKAKDLANTLLVVQKMHKGEYVTFLVPPTPDGEFEQRGSLWMNCAQHVADVLFRLAGAGNSQN